MKKAIAVGIILLAALLRLYDLGNPPLFFDESVHSYFVNAVLKGSYRYDPAFHGPLLFYTVAPIIYFLGENEFTLRLLPAVLGVVLVCSIFLYRRYIGDAAYFAALFVAVSPVIVNYSRFYREDVYQLLFTSLVIYFLLRYLEGRRSWKEFKVDRYTAYLISASTFLALFSAVKETFYVFAALLLIYLIFDLKRIRIFDAFLALLAFSILYTTFYTNLWTDFSAFKGIENFPAVRAVEYWKYQHDIARISGPPYYYFELILIYDLPAFLLALVAIYRWLKGEKDEFTSIFVFLFLANFFFYSCMQEKVPWLVVHIEFPMFILAAKVANRKSTTLAAIYLLFGCVMLNVVNPVNPAEPALYLPTQYDVREISANFVNYDRVYILATAGEYWPLVWYLKNYSYFVYQNFEDLKIQPKSVIVANQTQAAEVYLTNRETMVVRCWTFWTKPEINKIPEFLILRRPLAEVYCMNFTIFYT
ncbi:MAG: TIGR03663 family protein [Archaeoglobaceae archaeon]